MKNSINKDASFLIPFKAIGAAMRFRKNLADTINTDEDKIKLERDSDYRESHYRFELPKTNRINKLRK